MNGSLTAFITISLLTTAQLASAGPLGQNVKRQDDSTASPTVITTVTGEVTTLDSTVFPTGSAIPTSITGNPASTLPIPSTVSFTDGVPPPVASTSVPFGTATTEAPNTSFTPFTGTFASAPPVVSKIDSWMSEHPEYRTKTHFPHHGNTHAPCNCPATITTTVTIFGTGTDTGFPAPTDSTLPSASDCVPSPSGVTSIPSSDVFSTATGVPSPIASGDVSTSSTIVAPTFSSDIFSTPSSDAFSTSSSSDIFPTSSDGGPAPTLSFPSGSDGVPTPSGNAEPTTSSVGDAVPTQTGEASAL